MKKRIVLALGGNALGKDLSEQMQAVQGTASALAGLIEEGHELVITHGNGPQVGMIHQAFEAAHDTQAHSPVLPMSVCVALSQGYIGYDLQNALREELCRRGIHKNVVSLITQVRVDERDPAFNNPDKPIGSFLSPDTAHEMAKQGITVREESGRGWRRVVASPMPQEIVETDAIKALLAAGQIPIAVGGGGIPVVAHGNHLRGASAVIDKDRASAVLANDLNADMLIILTAVEKVAIHFNTPQQAWLSNLTTAQARDYMRAGEFAPGSMLPKVEAAVAFAESRPGRQALITLLEKASDGIAGRTGTVISMG
ncbi:MULTISPECIES: carbamate kinase [Tenebrionibacter/Tenebrionicola group]|jgi:carbamate kinase|uniref:Carbamate kinase n=2 Tax=Tenebrionibacter/Tenebrionicola group TaxID=2969848 RepID=A0A8K0XWR3_9ENTR|nr:MULTISPECIES: carbamate kinase [Tenebrionibacter/Tenebrionicola group]MBK4714828.1 carbamate kinase [Tenebrionibacter intestinalis]MBV4414067.1 carbamate kinase [Tenebrionicola larvae]MBV5095613.1 carbamate kinase [Tenebrionicola larvae]